jgi:hypothetical protein
MICFALELNGRRLKTAGIAGHAVLSSNVTWVQRHPRHAAKLGATELSLHLGGLDSNSESGGTHLNWVDQKLKVGDRVVLRVLERDRSDPATSQHDEFTSEELDRDRVQSARHYLKEYRRQRVVLDRMIREAEKVIAESNKKKANGRAR